MKTTLVLSPTLFNIFINDLSTELNSLRIGITLGDDKISHLLYADDLTDLMALGWWLAPLPFTAELGVRFPFSEV